MSLQRNAEQLRSFGLVWFVDSTGNVHALDLCAYAQLTAEQLEGSRAFMAPDNAYRFARQVRNRN